MPHEPCQIIQTEVTVEWPESEIEQDLPVELRVGSYFGVDGYYDDYAIIYVHEEGVEYDVTDITKLNIEDIKRIITDRNRESEGY